MRLSSFAFTQRASEKAIYRKVLRLRSVKFIKIKLVPIESLYAISYWSSIVTICLPSIVSEIWRVTGWKAAFFLFLSIHYLKSSQGGSTRTKGMKVGINKWVPRLPNSVNRTIVGSLVSSQCQRVMNGQRRCIQLLVTLWYSWAREQTALSQ